MMQTVRIVMRGTGRLAVCALLLTLFFAAYHHQQPLIKHYAAKYDPFRFLLYQKRIMDLPPSKYIEGLLEYFYVFDLGYGLVTGLLILWGKRIGGWMMVLWYSVKLAVFYLPHLFNTPRQPFKMNDRYEMMRQFALLGVALALSSASPKTFPAPLQPESQQPKAGQPEAKSD